MEFISCTQIYTLTHALISFTYENVIAFKRIHKHLRISFTPQNVMALKRILEISMLSLLIPLEELDISSR